jgi:hypothetical protein
MAKQARTEMALNVLSYNIKRDRDRGRPCGHAGLRWDRRGRFGAFRVTTEAAKGRAPPILDALRPQAHLTLLSALPDTFSLAWALGGRQPSTQ